MSEVVGFGQYFWRTSLIKKAWYRHRMRRALLFMLLGFWGNANPLFSESPQACAQSCRILKAHFGLGGGTLGTEHAPDAILNMAALNRLRQMGILEEDISTLKVPSQYRSDWPSLGVHPATKDFLLGVKEWVMKTRRAGQLPIMLGGDHSLSMASASASKAYAESQGKRMALVWMDAHTDRYFSLGSRNVPHAIVVNHLLGEGREELNGIVDPKGTYKPEDVFFVGARDSLTDTLEARTALRDEGFILLSPEEMNSQPMEDSLHQLLARLSRYDEIHFSFDIDVVDDMELMGFGYYLPGGFTRAETQTIVQAIMATKKVRSLDFVELNPSKDRRGATASFLRGIVVESLKAGGT